MAVAFGETPNSRRMVYKIHGGETNLFTEHWVRWDGVGTFPGYQSIQATSGLPIERDRLPEAIHESNAFLKRFVTREVTWAPDARAPYRWIVQARSSTFANRDGTPWSRITRNTGFRTVPMYRLGATLPTDGDITWASATDMAGTKVDIFGQPEPYQVAQQTIVLETWLDRTTAVTEPDASTLLTYANTRNSVAIFGCAIGSLLYKGFAISQQDEFSVLQHTWLWDAWKHCEQRPLPNATGHPILGSGTTIDSQPVKQVSKVTWFQRYTTKTDHDDLLDTVSGLATNVTTPAPTAL